MTDTPDDTPARWPHGVTFSSEQAAVDQCVAVAALYDWSYSWDAQLLTPDQLADYQRALSVAWEDYLRIRDAAREDCDRTRAAALVVYQRTRAAARTDYERIRAAAYARAYHRSHQP